MRRSSTRGFFSFAGGLLLVASALGLPMAAAAQVDVCNGDVDTNIIAGPSFGIVGSVYTITVDLGAGTITGTDPQFLDVSVVRYELDCQNVGAVGCTDEGTIMAFGGNLSTSADCVDSGGLPVTFTASHAAGEETPNTLLLTGSAPVQVPEGKSPLDADACQITFDIVVENSPGTDSSPLFVQGGAGFLQNGTDAVCTNGLPGGAQSSTQIPLCQTGCAEQDTDCETFECSTETGQCVGTPVAPSTPCDDVADTEECANPGCDGAGTCSPTHLPEPDSTSCADTGLECWTAGCQAGVCEQMHLPTPPSTPCTETPDTEECASPGCDGAGTCSATHIPDPDSTPCGDTGLECWIAGCAAGVCEQMHTPTPPSTPCTETADTEECANPGCDGAGTCSATHLPEPDSTPCGDTGLDCWLAGCAAGVCEQMHAPEAPSTPCDDVADTEECANPGCDGAGTCSPTHVTEPDSTECADADGNPCSVAGCEAGVCEQVHACEPDGKPECEITLGDFIWNDGNGDGLQDTEPGIDDVDLTLIECVNGELPAGMTTTSGGGIYGFTVTAVTDLETCEPVSRTFRLAVDDSNFASGGVLESLLGSPQDVGGDDAVDSDCDPLEHETECTSFPPGTTDLTIDCGFVPEQGCLTRTPGFWCTHPHITELFLPLESCGIDLTGVESEAPGSATEDLVFGNDHKAANTSPQQLQLIRQCAAAALNVAASEANDGSCEGAEVSSGETIAEVLDACCGEDLCDSDASAAEITGSGCIELLDEFNNSQDTLGGACVGGLCEGTTTACDSDEQCAPAPFNRPGPAQAGFCQDANGNGFVNPGRDLGPGGGGPPAGPPNGGPKKK